MMICRKCSTQMFIARTGYFAEGDNSEQTPTKLFHRAYFACRNQGCSEYGQELSGEATLLYSENQNEK